MKVIVEQIGPCRKSLRIEVPAEQVTTEYQQVIKSIAARARIPGFRQGKAPSAIVEKQFSKDALEETRERLVPMAYQTALKQENLKPVAVVDVSDVQISKQFALPPYKGIAITSQKIEVKDEEIEQVLTSIRERSAHFESVTSRPAQKEDVVEIDYNGVCDGHPMSEVAPDRPELAQGKDFWVLLSDKMPEFLPGIKAQIEGIEIGMTREVNIAFPADYRAKSVAGKTATYTVTAKGIRERKSPELTDDFAKTVGAESVADLRVKVKENLVATATLNEANRQKDLIVKWVTEHTPLNDLPQSLVEEEARHIIQDVVQENMRRGVSKDDIESHREDIFNRAAQSSSERVKVNYILNRIADEEQVTVSEADMEKRFSEMVNQYGQSPEKLKADMEKRGAIETLRRNLRLEKAVDLLHAAATITPEG